MKRNIIRIDEEKCNGCGECVSACPEGAIKLIDGKAKLVGELYCDGLGACIGDCPEDAISIEEREAEKYNEGKVIENVVKQGKDTIKAHLHHLKSHGQNEYLKEALDFLKKKNIHIALEDHSKKEECGCPGSKTVDFRETSKGPGDSKISTSSELRQWPVQLKLLNPDAPYFKDADILIAADCVPFAYPDFHNKFLKGKILIIFCPKLDEDIDMYVEKLTQIFKNNNVKSVTLLHMEVPCCFGLVKLVKGALEKSGKNIPCSEKVISIKGEIQEK